MKHTLLLAAIAALTLVSCRQESDVAAYNVSQAAHSFEVNRRAVFYNGITGEYILTIEGLLSVEEEGELEVASLAAKEAHTVLLLSHKVFRDHWLSVWPHKNIPCPETWLQQQIAKAINLALPYA